LSFEWLFHEVDICMRQDFGVFLLFGQISIFLFRHCRRESRLVANISAAASGQLAPHAEQLSLQPTTDDDAHASTPGAMMEHCLRAILDTLVKLAIEHGSPVLADHLKASIRRHGSARLTAVSLKMSEQATQLAVAVPAATHGIGMWFRPMVARYLREQQITTLAELS
jgi:hypothetical protein